MAQHKAKSRSGSGKASGAAAKSPALSAERVATVHKAARALPPDQVRRAPGGLGKRLSRMQRAAQTALARGDALVAVPMAPEAALTREELQQTADHVTVLALTMADFGAASAEPTDPTAKSAETEARAAQVAVLRGIRHVFRGDRVVRQWVRKVARGKGLADLVSDADEMQAFWTRHATELSVLTRGEREHLTRMVMLANGLRAQVRAASGATEARRLRDAVYTLATQGIARIRGAVGYAFEAGDPVLAAFRTTPPRKKKAGGGEK